MNTKQNPLIGRTLIAVYLAEDKEAIRFVTDAGDVIAHCDADCCSYTWIEHVELPTLGLPAQVTAVENIELNTEADRRGGELEFYGLKIATDKGDFIMDYRNESNGYYGGSLVWPGARVYGGVYGQNVSNERWVLLP